VAELTADVIAFLSEGTKTAKLGFTASDGRPLVAPVWFVVDNGELAFNTGKDTAKGRAPARDPRAMTCVDDDRPPYSFVQVQGMVSISEDPADLLDIATRAGGRYMGADRAEEYGRRNGCPASWWCACVRRRCSRLSTWPNSRHRSRSPQPWFTQ
jgi:PPOX class probable F420-dependent enzyme